MQKPVRDALGVEAGDRVRYVISGDGVQVLKMPSEKTLSEDPALLEALDAAEEIMDENHTLLRKLKWILIAKMWYSEK